MQVTKVEVTPVDQGAVRTFATIVVDHCLSIRDIRVISRPNGYLVAMPSNKVRNGRFVDFVAPLNKETRTLIDDAVLNEYERVSGERVVRRNSGD
jgi:stage V sporulation protein G